jgi:hypothetical protein
MGLSIVLIGVSFSIRGKLNAEHFSPLPSNGLPSFIEDEMDEKWQFFCTWLKSSKAQVGVLQNDRTSVLFTPELLDYELLEIFILGETRHRDLLMGDASINTSPLVIRTGDWEDFEKLWLDDRLSKKKNPPLNIVSVEIVEPPKPATPHARECPRFKLMLQNKEEFFERYVALDIKSVDLTNKRKPCHNLLILFAENLDLLDTYFAGHSSRLKNTQLLSEFEKRITEILEINGNTNAHRLKTLLKLEWRTLEKHLEDVGLITAAELDARMVKR